MKKLSSNLSFYFNRKFASVLLLGFSSGMPLMLVGGTLQAWYASAGVSIMAIGMLSLVGQPYLLKFFWAPVFDRFAPLPFLGRRRSWILLMQLLLALGFTFMAFLTPQINPLLLASIAFLVAFFSASQDIAIDAHRTDILKEKELGLGASLFTVGYRFAMLLTGAVALIMADQIGWKNTYLIMAAIMYFEMIVTLLAPRPADDSAPESLQTAIVAPIQNFWERPHALIIILFIITFKLCDAIGLSLNTAFLLRGVGFSLTEVGAISKTVGLVSALIGSIMGGMLLPYMGLYRSLLCFGTLQAIALLPFAALAIVGHSYRLLIFSVCFENLGSSLSTIGIMVLLMSLCDSRYTATQYALFSAIASVARVMVGPFAGFIVESCGWPLFYIISALFGIPTLLILMWLQRHTKIFELKKIEQDVSLGNIDININCSSNETK